jgi:hypothetical protein
MTGLSLLMGLGAVCGLIAAAHWFKVVTSLDAIGDAGIRTHRKALGNAATATAVAFVIASLTLLIAVVTT